jgi:hypothetical protein
MVEGSLVVSRVLRCDEDGLVSGLPPEEVHRRALEARRMLGRAQRALSFWLVEVERRELFRQFGCSSPRGRPGWPAAIFVRPARAPSSG